jgi:hypothetical protein
MVASLKQITVHDTAHTLPPMPLRTTSEDAMVSKLSLARLAYDAVIERAVRAISTDGVPSKFHESQSVVGKAMADAGLPPVSQRKVLAHMLALYLALDEPPPLTARDLRKSLKSFERASNRILELDELGDVLRDVIEIEPSPDGEPIFQMVDPIAKIRCSLEAALPRARRKTRSHGASGRRISPMTTAVYALVDLVIEIEPAIKRPALTEFVATVLAFPIGIFNLERRRNVREPRWAERVGEALEDRKRLET